MAWTPRTVEDQDVQFPYRYNLKDVSTGSIVATYDIEPSWVADPSEVIQKGTDINAAFLQKYEDGLKAINDDLASFGLQLEAVQQHIADAHARLDGIDTAITTVAPLLNPVLTNPRANHVPVSSNDTSLTTTKSARDYFESLMAQYRG